MPAFRLERDSEFDPRAVNLSSASPEADRRKRRFEFEQSLLDADRVAAQAIQEVNVTVRAFRSASEEVEVTRRAKIAAEETVKGENVRFELGQTANEDLLRAQDVLAAAEREHLQALPDLQPNPR